MTKHHQPTDFKTSQDVHYLETRQGEPIFTLRCECGAQLEIGGSDTAEPVECEECGITWDIAIWAEGARQTLENS